jgi:hypothetical protein
MRGTLVNSFEGKRREETTTLSVDFNSSNKSVLLEESKSTDNLVVSSLLLPSKEFTRVPLIKTKRNPMILSPTIELVSLPMEVSGDSHSSYLGMHALTTIFEEKRVVRIASFALRKP